MANTASDDEDPTENGNAPAQAASRGKALGKLLIIAGGVALLLASAVTGAYLSGLLDDLLGNTAEPQLAAGTEAAPPPEPIYYALPEILVTLNTGERRSTLLKVRVNLELPNPTDQTRVERQLPRILDYCQVYLRELRPEEVRGSAGSARIREELLRRISVAVAPAQVSDLLFSDLFMQ
ncbi:MAG: flagellar basal body-associated FliL family protein [Defluviicoccus sp.]|nr:MAG: flagellar basal body-associated FliL family protein [Defluviicoccus sp.]